MKIALCNEVLREIPFERQCSLAAALGYNGLEVAPFTLASEPSAIDDSQRAAMRRAAEDAGLAISGLHWLLVQPEGLSITTDDGDLWERSVRIMEDCVTLCGDLGGRYLVHGSPQQRWLPDDPASATEARKRAIEAFARAGQAASRAGVVYCIEPLTPPRANFILSVAEAAQIVETIDNPAFRTMIDCSAAGRHESDSVPALIERWVPDGTAAHIHANDSNRLAPGQGTDDFTAILKSLQRLDYDHWIGVEPFDYIPDGPTCAARAIGYLHGIMAGN
jgi:D-psicose/D-tagatose/L-ribulose 3-epimerase